MRKVITYGTYDLLHRGHVKLLERAKELGDYLIVGVTSEAFDRMRGKINVKQTLIERIDAVRALGVADEVIVEEYEGQKIDDILRYDVNVFTVGSDWKGYFDYLKDYCEVVYLDRTRGVSSSELRSEHSRIVMGYIGDNDALAKYVDESRFVNGMESGCVLTSNDALAAELDARGVSRADTLDGMLGRVDAVYVASHPSLHTEHARQALKAGKHVLCEAPSALSVEEHDELHSLAKEKGLVFMDGLKTAYSIAYHRLKLLAKSGRIGRVVAVDATCTSLRDLQLPGGAAAKWNSMCAWGPTAILPVFQLLGLGYSDIAISSRLLDGDPSFDVFSKVDFAYPHAVATVKVGKGVKSEGELVVSGTEGYIYVPAPWWKTDYFEVRYEDSTRNRRFFYQLDGEGIRNELVAFVRAVEGDDAPELHFGCDTSRAIVEVVERFHSGGIDHLL